MANMPLTDIGITPRKASQFASKGIETVTDLLGYYPTKYLDFRNPISFAEGKYHQGEHVAIKGKVVSGRVIDGKHYMLRLTDGNTFCTVFWFNQPFRTRQFSVGDVIALGGVVSWNEQYNNMTMATPDLSRRILRQLSLSSRSIGKSKECRWNTWKMPLNWRCLIPENARPKP